MILYLVFALFALYFLSGKIEKLSQRRKFQRNGTKFEGYVIGVARKKKVIEAKELEDTAFLGSKKCNIEGYYPGTRGPIAVEDRGDARVKISFIHPVTQLPTKIRTILKKGTYRDSRIYRSAQPNLIRFDKVGITIFKHNHRLLSAYKQDVNSRNINEQEKQTLLIEARQAKKNYYDEYYARPRDDWEGYDLMHPTVPVQGYYLDGDFLFIQRTNVPPLEDWTEGLK